MAEAVLFDIAGEIIIKLNSEVVQRISLLPGVKDEIEKLTKTIHSIRAVLLDAEEQYSRNTQIKAWLELLKEAIFSAEDISDDIYTEALRRKAVTGSRIGKKVRLFFSHSNHLIYSLKMIRKIKDIRNRLEEIAAIRSFSLVERQFEAHDLARVREQTYSHPSEMIFVRNDDKGKIIDFLLDSSYKENLSIISIVGIGGLGKTTLAQLVFHDEQVRTHFELTLWVCVSDNFDIKVIVQKLLDSMTGERLPDLQMETLRELLHGKIKGKKYLIVLDDVWNQDSEKWLRLKDLLIAGAKGSKIMITTRIRKVAEVTRSVVIHELQALSPDESWMLLKQMAIKPGQVLSSNQEVILKEIVSKSAGIPLAIKTIGSLLYFKETESEWLVFKDIELSKVESQENDVLPSLKLSYDNLPSHLKHCFAYCSLFPKDYEIDIEMLIHLWMAQEYIEASDPNQSLEKAGFECFTDLLFGSFFQEVAKDRWGNIKTCRMPVLMHDLAMLVAGGETAILSESHKEYFGETRHISGDFYDDSIWSSLAKVNERKMRTLLGFSNGTRQLVQEQCRRIFSKFRCLRVLDLHDQGIAKLPHSIDKLKHLRYLDLSRNDVERLPNSISKLQNLQVLKLESCRQLRELPNSIIRLQNLQVLKLDCCYELAKLPLDIKRLVNLKHLSLYKCNRLTHMPHGIGQLTSLEKLTRFVVVKDNSASMQSSGLDELHGLNNLTGELEIVNLQYVKNAESRAANLREKKNLQSLSLQWVPFGQHSSDHIGDDVRGEELALEGLRPHQNLKELFLYAYSGVKSPSWLAFLRNLESIFFENCPRITMMSRDENDSGEQWQGLKSLRSIKLEDLPELVSLPKGLQYVTTLQSLTIRGCPKLISLPAWMANLTVQHLDISHCPQLSEICKNKGEGWPNIAHIPNIVVDDDMIQQNS